MSDIAATALAIALPNAASLVGCASSGGFSLSGCCKASEETNPCPCPVPKAAWHAVLFAANSSTGYASYLVWKELRGFGHHEHAAFAAFLASNAVHPILLKKCDHWGCGPAIINAVAGVGLAFCITKLFMKVDRSAGHYFIPGAVLALLRAGCTISCAGKNKCGTKADSGCCKK